MRTQTDLPAIIFAYPYILHGSSRFCPVRVVRMSILLLLIIGSSLPGLRAGDTPAAKMASSEEVEELRGQISQMQRELRELRALLLTKQEPLPSQNSVTTTNTPASGLGGATAPPSIPAQQLTTRVDELSKKTEGTFKNLGGFKLSGDFRFRGDLQLRSGNGVAAPLQNIRSRYRVRLNLDKEIDPRFRVHLQLSTGPYNVGTTNDQDFSATSAKHPFSIAEAYVDFHPRANFALRGGRMEEVFADNTRFLWDDDVRFNGFQQTVAVPLSGRARLEFRAGEYLLGHPNVAILSESSPLVAAGFKPGTKVRDAALFHPGFVLKSPFAGAWTQQVVGDIQLYRNPNLIQLASTPNGFPVLISNALGLMLSGPMSAAGNATTTPGGAIYAARKFQVVRVGYRLERKLGSHEVPLWFDFQGSRNVGTSRLRDAVIASANLGAVKKFGDTRFLYQFAIKDANAMISQFTDDDLGTGTGVNLAVHAVRFDLGLTHFLQWQNLLFIQDERRANDPAHQFFVPLQRGANTTFRFLGQLAFSF